MSTMFAARLLFVALIAARSGTFLWAQATPPAQVSPPLPSSSQQPAQPNSIVEQTVYLNPTARVTLGGTWTRPSAGGPFPTVLLIPGSGAQDRDETVGPHKPLFILARHLASRGIAVLRVDRRGVGTSTGDLARATTRDFASDAEAGVRYLLTRPDVDQKHIGLIGHGEGAIIASLVAGQNAQIAFMILLATPAVPGQQVLLTQRERAEQAAHMPPDQIAMDKKIATMVYDMVRAGKKQDDIVNALSKQKDLKENVAWLWENQLPFLESPWLRFFLSYDPVPALEKIRCPLLALAGEKDKDVVPDQNVPALKAALARGGNPDATVQILPGLNYFFQTATTGLPMEYPVLPEAISSLALNTISDWITKHTS